MQNCRHQLLIPVTVPPQFYPESATNSSIISRFLRLQLIVLLLTVSRNEPINQFGVAAAAPSSYSLPNPLCSRTEVMMPSKSDASQQALSSLLSLPYHPDRPNAVDVPSEAANAGRSVCDDPNDWIKFRIYCPDFQLWYEMLWKDPLITGADIKQKMFHVTGLHPFCEPIQPCCDFSKSRCVCRCAALV